MAAPPAPDPDPDPEADPDLEPQLPPLLTLSRAVTPDAPPLVRSTTFLQCWCCSGEAAPVKPVLPLVPLVLLVGRRERVSSCWQSQRVGSMRMCWSTVGDGW